MIKNKKILHTILFIQVLIYLAYFLINSNQNIEFLQKNMLDSRIIIISSIVTVVCLSTSKKINYVELIIAAFIIVLLFINPQQFSYEPLLKIVPIALVLRLEEYFILGRSHLEVIKEKLNNNK